MTDLIDAATALAIINGHLANPIERSLFYRSIRPLMLACGDAQEIGKSSVYSRLGAERWAAYMAAREARIAAGEWPPKHPYTIADMEALTAA